MSLSNLKKSIEYISYYEQLSLAFKEDCETLIRNFVQSKTYSFQSFAAIWRQMLFTFVLAARSGQHMPEETFTFLDSCFYTIKKYIVFPNDIHVQVGAFYLLYGLYYKQPIKNQVKIRWTIEEWEALNILSIRLESCNEFTFIFNKLRYDQAFTYVSTIRSWGLDLKYVCLEKNMTDDTFHQTPYPALIKNTLNSDNFASLENLENVTEEYESEMIAYIHENQGIKMDFEPSDLIENIQAICKELEDDNDAPEEADVKVVKTRKGVLAKAFTKKPSPVKSITSSVYGECSKKVE